MLGYNRQRVAHAAEYLLTNLSGVHLLQLTSPDSTNKLTSAKVLALAQLVDELARQSLAEPSPAQPIVLSGNARFFSAGADLREIRALQGPEALAFARSGQRLMRALAVYPAPVIAAIDGYCMGGGLDLALACDHRICSASAIFGHRGATLGILTGWGGTQRLPRLIGKARALQMFINAEKVSATEALALGLVDQISAHPVARAIAYAARCLAR